MGRLCRATCTIHSISVQTSQEGIKCTKDKEQLRAYCPNIYTVCLKQTNALSGQSVRACRKAEKVFFSSLSQYYIWDTFRPLKAKYYGTKVFLKSQLIAYVFFKSPSDAKLVLIMKVIAVDFLNLIFFQRGMTRDQTNQWIVILREYVSSEEDVSVNTVIIQRN